MPLLRQLILGIAVLAGTFFLWVNHVPSAARWLDRVGVLALVGMEAPESDAPGPGRAGGFGAGGPTAVAVVPVTQGVMNQRVTAIGDGRALHAVTVRAKATGRISEINLEAGGWVEKDTVIFRLDDEAERIAFDRASLMRRDAEDEVQRLSQLGDSGAVAAVRLREAGLALQIAELELRQAAFNLEQREILSPVSGWAGLLEVEVGDRVSAQDALAVITDRSQIILDFRVPERLVGDLRTGMPLQVTPLAMPDTVLAGEVSAIDNVVDRNSRTLRVQGRLANAGDRLRAGMAFSVTLSLEGEEYPSIDPLAIQWSAEGSYVWVVRDGKAEQVRVLIRQRNSDSVLVEAELETGDQVITEGVQTLRPAAPVTVVNAASAQAAAGAAPQL